MSFGAFVTRAKRDGMPVVAEYGGDATFFDRVDWAVVSWRGWRSGRHAVLFCGWEQTNSGRVAVILDSNDVKRLRWCPEAEFLAFWRKWGGDAVGLVKKYE